MTWGRNRAVWLPALVLPAMVSPPAAGQSTPTPRAATAAGADTVRLAPATPAESLLTGPTGMGGEQWSLARCIQTALEKNADVQSAQARTKEASGSALSAWNGIIPSLNAGAAYTYSKPDKNSAFTRVEIDTLTGAPPASVIGLATKDRFSSLSASLNTNILSPSAIGEKKRRDHLRSSSQLDEVETRNQVVFQVKQQYFELLKAERLAQVARETERLARDEETRAQALFEVGTVARGDVLKARAHRATTQADRLTAENQVN